MAKMRVRFPMLVLLLGVVFLLAVSIGIAYGEKDVIKNPERPEERQEEERDPRQPPRSRQQEEQEREHRREKERDREPSRGRSESKQSQEEERERRKEHDREREQEQQPQYGRRHEEEEKGEEEEEGQARRQRPQRRREEREQEQGSSSESRRQSGDERRHRHEKREQREEREQEQGSSSGRQSDYGRRQRHEGREQREEREQEQGSSSESHRLRNPYYFSSERFQTRYKNKNGQIRVLERFDQRTNRLENLQNYRIVEFQSRPNTLILPKHSDADYILVVLNGRATITIVNPDKRQAYNLEYGDALRLPAGTTSYILNPDDNQDLRVVKLAIPINNPGKFYDFYPSRTKDQQSYFSGFSKNTLEATFNTHYEEIQRILLGYEDEQEDEEQRREQEQSHQDEGVIVRVSKEQIQELRKHAQSSSRKGKPSESGPFNLRSNEPIYSNKFGNFYEITPDRNPQVQDLDISLIFTEISEGALLLPHYNSKAIFVIVVDEGEGNYELVGIRNQQRQQDEQEVEEVRSYNARLSEGDILVIPAGHPLSINASSNLRLLGFGINADENQRNFLAGSEDNVIRQLDREVKELIFPGSAEDVERLIRNQQQSYFANAQPQQQQQQREKEGRRGRRGPISSILSALY
ncbi:PREDICTED: conglutin beta 5 [Lupinus angustifolius]|uniref:Conglutin beta 5 n=1 Tax=Lupinus angustifolius TaxID=3871 RepID=CONB5_LUPAN|nr:conglutin beta 5 precursor [Lupinus angustifolius]F5B8W3.1 RecName: Full=Conglutin beta 5; AltName: Allergen=Lup an 1; Flags: Precursor [Lupinus angustifolius]AEB33716.1 conglutin beta 5 [Lupinus angustifolius]